MAPLDIPADVRDLADTLSEWYTWPIACLTRVAMVDPDALRRKAEEVWGVPGVDGSGQLTKSLQEIADEFADLDDIAARWEGPAAEAYREYVRKKLVPPVEDLVAALPAVGEALSDYADKMEISWWEYVGAALTLITLALGVVGVVLAVVLSFIAGVLAGTGVLIPVAVVIEIISLVIGFVSLLLSFIGVWAMYQTSIATRIESSADTTRTLKSQGALSQVESPEFSALGWQPRSADPYS
jgi:uncharacterized protein YukE